MKVTITKDDGEVTEAATQARRFAHGSLLHSQAMTVLFRAYRTAHPDSDGSFITLESLWAWVDGKAPEKKRFRTWLCSCGQEVLAEEKPTEMKDEDVFQEMREDVSDELKWQYSTEQRTR